jgi:CheY-like chemotaxis protein
MADKSSSPKPQQSDPAASAEYNPSNYKLLVVEDEGAARIMFVDLLESEGYEASSAIDGVDALAKAAADKFDLILLDIVMPNKDGIEVLQEIKANTAKYGTPVVVMLTNISGDAAVEKAMEIGAAGFKLKIGTEPEELLEEVKAFLKGKIQNIEDEPVTQNGFDHP